MTDVLAERCSDFADLAIDLMRASMESQSNAVKLAEVVGLIGKMRSIVSLPTDGIENATFLQWNSTAPETLDAMEQAASRGDARAVWVAFTDPRTGMAGLGQGCAGYPRW
jgi:hypothetical protein